MIPVKPENTDYRQKAQGTKFAFALAGSLIAIAIFQNYVTDEDVVVSDLALDNPAIQSVHPLTRIETAAPDRKQILVEHIESRPLKLPASSRINLDYQQLVEWVNNDQYVLARHELMKKASAAVDQNDKHTLGEIIRLLAKVSATQGDLASAEVYLFEALDIFSRLGESRQIADTQLLIGQMYTRRRQIAQQAGWAYGELLLARFFLSEGNSYAARESLDKTIRHNLKLGRTGAAASAYKTMARYYRSIGDSTGATDSMIEAARNYAHSGQDLNAQQVIDSLREQQVSLAVIEELEDDISNRLARYESQITLVRQARDYMQLYSLYKIKGEAGRAWEFRVKASEILSRTSKRDMYFRSPDVMALLYDSNFNITRASDYYKKAGDIYLSQNNLDGYDRVMSLKSSLN